MPRNSSKKIFPGSKSTGSRPSSRPRAVLPSNVKVSRSTSSKQAISASTRNEAKNDRATLNAIVAAEQPSAARITVEPVIRQAPLFEYFFGYFSGCLSGDSSPAARANAVHLAAFCVANIQNYEDCHVEKMPDVYWEIALALAPSVSGNYAYAPDFSEISLATTSSSFPSAWVPGIIPAAVTSASIYDTDGWPNVAPPAFDSYVAITPVEADRLLSKYSGIVLMNSATAKLKYGPDPSIFAFPGTEDVPLSLVAPKQIKSLFYANSQSGYNTLYQCSSGTASLEVRIKSPHLARLRLAGVTASQPGYTQTYQGSSTGARAPRFSVAATGTPAGYGWLASQPSLKGKEIRPTIINETNLISGMMNVWNQIYRVNGVALSLGPFDFALLSWWLVRWYQTRYAGARYGAVVVFPSSTSYPSTSAAYVDTLPMLGSALESMAFPEKIVKLLCATDIYVAGNIVHMPYFQPWIPDLSLIMPSNTKPNLITNTPVSFNTAPIEIKQSWLQYNNNMDTVLLRYSYAVAQFAAMVVMSNTRMNFPSCTDASVMISSGTLTGIVSTRSLTSEREAYLLSVLPALGAMNAVGTSDDFLDVVKNATFAKYSKTYNTPIQYSTYVQLASQGALLPGTEQSNIPAEHDYNLQEDPAPAPRSLSYSVGKALGRIKGNYCGAGWTAGSYIPSEWATDKEGRFAVPATDAEDQICKEHDEQYTRVLKGPASTHQTGIMKADQEMSDRLKELSQTQTLSPAMWFASKWFNTRPSADKDSL